MSCGSKQTVRTGSDSDPSSDWRQRTRSLQIQEKGQKTPLIKKYSAESQMVTKEVSILTNDIERERDKAMVSGKREQECIHEHDVLEVVDQTLSVKEVVGAEQEVPIGCQKKHNVRKNKATNTALKRSIRIRGSETYQFMDLNQGNFFSLLGTLAR